MANPVTYCNTCGDPFNFFADHDCRKRIHVKNNSPMPLMTSYVQPLETNFNTRLPPTVSSPFSIDPTALRPRPLSTDCATKIAPGYSFSSLNQPAQQQESNAALSKKRTIVNALAHIRRKIKDAEESDPPAFVIYVPMVYECTKVSLEADGYKVDTTEDPFAMSVSWE